VTRFVSAIPAYGRDYTTEEACRADWEAGKDFLTQDIIVGDHYVNKDDKPDDWQLNLRYNNKQEICVITALNAPVVAPAPEEQYLD
jgi:hypothetical protein